MVRNQKDSDTYTRKVNMKELITEVTQTSISNNRPPLVSTDQVVSQYEAKLNATIAAKVLQASKAGKSASFTKEEIAFLNKKACEDGPLAEIKVITPDPTITLKKGNTEINIKNAATLVKKMEEIYPSPNRSRDMDIPVNQQDIDGIIQELEEECISDDSGSGVVENEHAPVMRERFKKLVSFPSNKVSPEVRKAVDPDVETFDSNFVAPCPPPTDFKTVNKNAYEIRNDVLGMALDWVKFKKEVNGQLNGISDEDVLSTAQKFYKFVEDRRR